MSEQPDIDSLLDQLQNGIEDDPDARWRAAIALGAVDSPADRQRAVDALVNVLTTSRVEAAARAHAVESLGRLGDARAVPALMQALDDPYRLVRSYAIAPLAVLGDVPTVIPPLVNGLTTDDFFGVRAEAALGLVTVALRSGDAAVRRQVRDALTRQREVEVNTGGVGTERVIAEIDRGFKRLDRAS
jgi:HEAT repeat protein